MPNFSPTRLYFIFICCIALAGRPLASAGQSGPAVSGTVADSAGVPVEFATVTLHRATDSVVVKAEFTGAQGTFRLAAAGGRYRVSVAQVGFRHRWSPVFELTAAGLTLAPLVLAHSASTALKEVSVTAARPLYEHLADRTVLHVENSPLAAGATTLDLLGRAPGVTVDAGDNLGLRGRQGLLVLLDGKRLALTGTELGDLLRALPAEQVSTIELITNPPASYDAQGAAGVIAITLKKDQRLGTNGSLNAAYGRGEYGKFTGGGALNYRQKKFNAFGNYAYTDRRGFTRVDIERQFAPAGGPGSSSMQANDLVNHLQSHAYKAGVDYNFSARTLVGVAASGLANQLRSTNQNQTSQYDDAGALASRYHSVITQDVHRPNATLNANLRHTFADSAGAATLSADADYARYDTRRLTGLATAYDQPSGAPGLLAGNQQSTLYIESVKADYTRPLPHRVRLEAGAKTTRVRSDNDVAFDRTQNGVTARDLAISGAFRYDENVNAAYGILRRAGARTALQAGLRAEQTNTLGRSANGADRFERHYFQLFPSISVEHTLSEQHALSLALGRRIERPNYSQVNPLRVYIDPTSYGAGNPTLLPATSYNAELTHTFRQKFSTSLSYSRTDRPIVIQVQPAPDGNLLVVSRNVNLAVQHNYALTFTAPLTLAPWWTFYGNAVLYYARFVGGPAGGPPVNRRPAFTFTGSNTFALPGGWAGELNANFETGETFGYERLKYRGQVTAGVQKSLWAKQATLRLTVADIFYTTPVRSTQTYANFSETFFQRQDMRVATLAFTYRFGRTTVAGARKRAAGAEDELRRAAGQ
ncbi:outer membrane beta-barrel protein [Hymenobacter nivis]|uniref:TonB-dependent receptor n=1 Tax=Hymenobacter nivis TaxID=1850093 RepID=A0A2Z3GF93_9BACT|nr:outer membrane beta-barrel protein [Hymenobacter nivis]AWM32409.1 TonB-dependent receptor [Hymenobacter nivis]